MIFAIGSTNTVIQNGKMVFNITVESMRYKEYLKIRVENLSSKRSSFVRENKKLSPVDTFQLA